MLLGDMLMNKHSLMNKHAKIDVPSRRVQDERQLFAAQIRAGRAVLGWSQTDLGERIALLQTTISFLIRSENCAGVRPTGWKLNLSSIAFTSGMTTISAMCFCRSAMICNGSGHSMSISASVRASQAGRSPAVPARCACGIRAHAAVARPGS
jgi:hypothetical protein